MISGTVRRRAMFTISLLPLASCGIQSAPRAVTGQRAIRLLHWMRSSVVGTESLVGMSDSTCARIDCGPRDDSLDGWGSRFVRGTKDDIDFDAYA